MSHSNYCKCHKCHSLNRKKSITYSNEHKCEYCTINEPQCYITEKCYNECKKSNNGSNCGGGGTMQGTNGNEFNVRACDTGTGPTGDPRGEHSVDLQTLRLEESQVASGTHSFVAGHSNTASNFHTLAIGKYNIASGNTAVALGFQNIAEGDFTTTSGYNNKALGPHSLAIGKNNIAEGNSSVVMGYNNQALGNTFNGVLSGCLNRVNGTKSVVCGGQSNTASNINSVVCGGDTNIATGDRSVISGGFYNQTGASCATIAGGTQNKTLGENSAVSGGKQNEASGLMSVVSGGYNNKASGYNSIVSGGDSNIAFGKWSWAGGQKAQALHDNTFVWGNSITTLASTKSGVFMGGIHTNVITGTNQHVVYVDDTNQLGMMASSIKYKENVQDMGDSTDKLHYLRPVTFKFKDNENNSLEYGLIAEEVEQVLPELVIKDENGQVQSVKYHVLPSMLLNEMKKMKMTIDELTARVQELENNN